jgi:hypothetical protein
MADVQNIIAATISSDGASIYAAPMGTALPTAVADAPATGWVELGWVGEDGVTNGIQRDTTKHYAWGGSVVKTTQDKYTETFKFTLLETSKETLALVFGTANVSGTGTDIKVEHSEQMLDRQMFIIDFMDGKHLGRHIIKDAMVTEVADLKYSHKEITGYELTVDVYKPSDGTAAVETLYTVVAPGSTGTRSTHTSGGAQQTAAQAGATKATGSTP